MDRFYWKRLGCHAASALLHQSCRALYRAKPTAVTLAPLRPKMACSWFRCLEKKGCWLLGCKTSFFGVFFGLFWKKSRFYVKVRYSDILSNQGMHRRFSCQVLAVHFFCCCGSSMNVNPPTLSTVGGFPNFRFIPCQT